MRHSDIKQTEQYAHLATNVAQRVVTVLDDEGDNRDPLSSTLAHYVAQSKKTEKSDSAMMEKIAVKLGG